jgi:DNA-binding LacI/PurR family transcriptional regulator
LLIYFGERSPERSCKQGKSIQEEEVMPRVTLKDVAAEAGVSYQTVSKVINGKAQVAPQTEQRIRQAILDLNYRPNAAAQHLRTQASNLIGYAWHIYSPQEWHPIQEWFLHSMTAAAEAQNYLVTLFNSSGLVAESDTQPYAELYARQKVDGFVVSDTIQDDPRIFYLMEEEIPFVAFGRANEEWDFCWVDVDGRYGIAALVSHLQQRGHQRIGLIAWPEKFAKTGDYREAGYWQGMEAAGLVTDPDWLVRGMDSPHTGAAGITQFLSLPQERRPTAVICLSDQIATGAIYTVKAANLEVGTDVAITGYDDIPIAKFLDPPLTTIKQPINEVGEWVVKLLLQSINDEPIHEKTILLKPELVIRESS